MECIIIYRSGNGKVGAITDAGVNICVFINYDEAQDFANYSKFLQSVSYQIVKLSEI